MTLNTVRLDLQRYQNRLVNRCRQDHHYGHPQFNRNVPVQHCFSKEKKIHDIIQNKVYVKFHQTLRATVNFSSVIRYKYVLTIDPL